MKEDELVIREDTEVKSNKRLKQISLLLVGIIVGLLLISGGFYGLLYVSTPAHLRNPVYEHYHIRTQIIVDGAAVDFSRDEFQEKYDANSCSAEITGQPIDFHDNQDQMAHVHWRGITGGEFLKFYGWNLIGGADKSMGRRYDQGMMKLPRIDTAGSLLPSLPEKTNFYVYVGDENNYQQKDWSTFLKEDLEDFIGKKSYLNTGDETSLNLLNLFSQKVSAHGSAAEDHTEPVKDENDEEKLERINNLIGNVVIFVQNEAPSNEQVKNRFNNLTPLHDSVCGG